MMIKVPMKALKNKKGISLVELLTGIAIFAILSVSVITALSVMTRISRDANDAAEINLLLDTLSNHIMSDANNAREINITETELEIKTRAYTSVYSANGTEQLKKTIDGNPALVYDARYYKNKMILLEFFDANNDKLITDNIEIINNPKVFTFKLTLLSNDRVIASRDYTIRPLGY